MSRKFNWEKSAARIQRYKNDLEFERIRIWEQSDDSGFDTLLAHLCDELGFVIDQIKAQKIAKAAS